MAGNARGLTHASRMDDSSHQRWLRRAIPVAVLYAAAGVASATLAGTAASDRMRFFWRLSAFVTSALVFVAHIAYERLRLGRAARATAWHVSVAVAIGAFGLAL